MNMEEFMQQDFKEVVLDKNNKVVISNELFNYTGMNDFKLESLRLIFSIISDIRLDEEYEDMYKIKTTELARFYSSSEDKKIIYLKNLYHNSKSIAKNLMEVTLMNEKDNQKEFMFINPIRKAGYKDGVFYIQFDDCFKHFIENVKRKFTQPLLYDFSKLKSTNSYLFWLLICSKLHHSAFDTTSNTKVSLTIEEILYFTGNHKKKTMKQYKNLKRRVIEPALSEYKNNFTGLQEIKLNEIKKGKKVVSLEIEFQGKFQLIKND